MKILMAFLIWIEQTQGHCANLMKVYCLLFFWEVLNKGECLNDQSSINILSFEEEKYFSIT
jgi:hypothetical protein